MLFIRTNRYTSKTKLRDISKKKKAADLKLEHELFQHSPSHVQGKNKSFVKKT